MHNVYIYIYIYICVQTYIHTYNVENDIMIIHFDISRISPEVCQKFARGAESGSPGPAATKQPPSMAICVYIYIYNVNKL